MVLFLKEGNGKLRAKVIIDIHWWRNFKSWSFHINSMFMNELRLSSWIQVIKLNFEL